MNPDPHINDYILTNPGSLEEQTPLYIAINNNCTIDYLDKLIKKGADINKGRVINGYYQNRSPLCNAIVKSMDVNMIKYLLENGAEPNFIENSIWRTPLDYLINNSTYSEPDKMQIEKWLLEKGAKTYIKFIAENPTV